MATIGVFDSGSGGLSVYRELVKLLPKEHYLYFSDNAHCPYGEKTAEYIRDRGRAITDILLGLGADIIVVACNTATAAAITALRATFDFPFVGMEPALKPAALHSQSGVVGVLATAGTFKGRLYLNTLARFSGRVRVIERVGTGLVELVEAGELSGPQVEALVASYVCPMLEEGADHIVLGCTHYPFLTGVIGQIVDGRAVIVNPAPAVARQAARVLAGLPDRQAGTGKSEFFSTGDDEIMRRLAREIAGPAADCFDFHAGVVIE